MIVSAHRRVLVSCSLVLVYLNSSLGHFFLPLVTSADLFRFGPGRLSRRYHNTKRLRRLRTRRSACPLRNPKDGAPLSRGSTGGGKSAKERTNFALTICSRDSKRQKASPGGAYPVVKKRPLREHPFVSAHPTLPQQEALRGGLTAKEARASQPPIGERDGCPSGGYDAWGQDCSGVNASPAASKGARGKAEGGGSRSRTGDSKVQEGPPDSPDEAPSIGSGSTATIGARGLSQILPVRSSPAPWRPRATSSSKSGNSRSGSSQTQISTDRRAQQEQQLRVQSQANAAASAARVAGAADTGDTTACGWGSYVGSEPQGIALADTDKRTVEFSAGARSGYPAVADTCGGIVLRMTPAERSLEPWGTTLAPLRAMCDIEPSLSRAGLEYRGVIHAVGGAQEMKSNHEINVRTR